MVTVCSAADGALSLVRANGEKVPLMGDYHGTHRYRGRRWLATIGIYGWDHAIVYACGYEDALETVCEYIADHLPGYVVDIDELVREILSEESELSEEQAWERAIEGCWGVNGGAVWVSLDEVSLTEITRSDLVGFVND